MRGLLLVSCVSSAGRGCAAHRSSQGLAEAPPAPTVANRPGGGPGRLVCGLPVVSPTGVAVGCPYCFFIPWWLRGDIGRVSSANWYSEMLSSLRFLINSKRKIYVETKIHLLRGVKIFTLEQEKLQSSCVAGPLSMTRGPVHPRIVEA